MEETIRACRSIARFPDGVGTSTRQQVQKAKHAPRDYEPPLWARGVRDSSECGMPIHPRDQAWLALDRLVVRLQMGGYSERAASRFARTRRRRRLSGARKWAARFDYIPKQLAFTALDENRVSDETPFEKFEGSDIHDILRACTERNGLTRRPVASRE